jgi:hypothetical protein
MNVVKSSIGLIEPVDDQTKQALYDRIKDEGRNLTFVSWRNGKTIFRTISFFVNGKSHFFGMSAHCFSDAGVAYDHADLAIVAIEFPRMSDCVKFLKSLADSEEISLQFEPAWN